MLTHHAHVALALGMLAIAGINAWLMLESFGGRTPKTASRRRAALHRWLGRTYLAVYVLLLVSMVRMALERDDLSAVEAIHGALGLALLPLLLVKILIVRRYPPLQGSLPLLGSLVLVLTFVTVAMGLLAGRPRGAAVSSEEIAGLPEQPGKEPFIQFCGQCHTLERPLGLARRARPDETRWLRLIAEMQQRAASRGRSVWTPEEGQAIASFLVAVGQGGAGELGPKPGGGDEDDRGRGRGRGRGSSRDDR